MRKIILLLCCIISASAAIGQQFLWTTAEEDSMKYVPIERVTNKVLEYYDYYQYYYDGSGYSKEGFFEMVEKYPSFKNSSTALWKKRIDQITSPTVFAFKDNSGRGSFIVVMYISKENINSIIFSNNFERDAIITYPFDREKFAKWSGTLLE